MKTKIESVIERKQERKKDSESVMEYERVVFNDEKEYRKVLKKESKAIK